ncbi:MAG: hypothetical protein FWC41_08475, partial [Firmicutes bacterium]|nr:hypothetical protein [Bacillota bacterium]
MIFKKKIKIFPSFLISLFLTLPFYTAMANNSPKQHNLKSLGKKTNSDGTILKLISGLAGVGLLAIGGKKLMDRNSKKIINQSGNECIQNQDIQNQFSYVKKQNLEEYLPINIPMPKWYVPYVPSYVHSENGKIEFDGDIGSCSLDSILTMLMEIMDILIGNLSKDMEMNPNTPIVNCLIGIHRLLKISEETGKKANIYTTSENGECKCKDRRVVCDNERNSFGNKLKKALGNGWNWGTHGFNSLYEKLLEEFKLIDEKYKKYDLTGMSQIFENSCLQRVDIKNLESKEFIVLPIISSFDFPPDELSYEKDGIYYVYRLHSVMIRQADHYFVLIETPEEYLSKELIKEGKRFIRRDSLGDKDS